MTRFIPWFWLLFLVWWLVRARGVKAARTSENAAARWTQTAVMVVSYTLIASNWFDRGILGASFISTETHHLFDPFFTLLALLGFGLAIWAREHLGRNWSVRITIKEGHELIRTGPYALIRHPIYTGILLAAFASALVVGHVHALIGFAVLAIGFWFKSRKEERWMAGGFGKSYEDYRKVSGHFLPRVARGGR